MSRFEVHIDLGSTPVAMADVEVTERAGRVARVDFTYRADYLNRPGRLALDPATDVTTAKWVSGALPRGLADAGPDGWGRSLLLRANRDRPMTEVDLLLAVDDTSRMGALRLRTNPDGPWEATSTSRIPALIHLAELQQAAADVEAGTAPDAAVQQLLGAGSGSLGGMRPKASVITDTGRLAIAKFSSSHDQISVIGWEKLCLDLAARAGITVPPNILLRIGERPVLVLERFDRTPDNQRVPYLSVFAITEAAEAASGDYADIAEALTMTDVADLPGTLRQLWRRAVFNVAVRNTDDHLRNHAILWKPGGWELSPAFDITPNPVGGAARATSIDGDNLARPETQALRRLAEQFGIDRTEQDLILAAVLQATNGWRLYAEQLRLPASDIRQLDRPLTEAHHNLANLAEQS